MIPSPSFFVLNSFWAYFIFKPHFALHIHLKFDLLWFNNSMSTQYNFNSNNTEFNNTQGKVKVTDLLSRLNEEKKIEKKRNLALGVAAVSAVTVFGIILTI